ncbi:MAG: nucleotidyltransferase domain-containing protein [archaeon]
MIQKCSLLKVLGVFFIEPTNMHFIREIGKKTNLAPTSVRNHIRELEKNNLIVKTKAKPFDGFVANRENEKFIFYKQAYNFYSLYELRELIAKLLYPKSIMIFGSYVKGEDTESSDIDIIILSKVKKEINLKKFEKSLNRKINLVFVENLNKLNKSIKINVLNGRIIYGGIDERDI